MRILLFLLFLAAFANDVDAQAAATEPSTQPTSSQDGSISALGNSQVADELVRMVPVPWRELLSAVLGAILGALAAAWLYTREARRQMKINTLRRFVSNRFDLTGVDFSQVINEIVVVFSDSDGVIRLLNEFRKTRCNAKMVQMYRAMSESSGIKHKHVSDDLFLTAFNVQQKST